MLLTLTIINLFLLVVILIIIISLSNFVVRTQQRIQDVQESLSYLWQGTRRLLKDRNLIDPEDRPE
jgi:hypothetical protein